MEGWRTLARSDFDDRMCRDSVSHFETVRILAYSGGSATYHRESVAAGEMDRFVITSAHTTKVNIADASLRLVCIRRTDHEAILISPKLFRRIFKAFDLDPAILYLINNNSYGFHRFPSRTDLREPGAATISFFVATLTYILMWSFSPETMTTNAIAMIRGGEGSRKAQAAYNDLDTNLRLYKDQIHTPHMLAAVAAIQTIRFLDADLLAQLRFLRGIEAFTGHGPYSYVGPRPVLGLEEINDQAGKVGNALVHIANHQRHADIIKSLLSYLYGSESDSRDGGSDADGNAKMWVRPLLPVLEQQLESTTAYITYLGERAKNQSTVLSNLLTHHDALTSTELANSSREIAAAARKDGLVMQEIATATRKDGDAMKTIAVMTMMFLPGTYFAALFAIPSLQWNQRPVIQDGFGIYWAFTLPATILVFVAWMFLTNWNKARDRVVAIFGNARRGTSEKSKPVGHAVP